MTTDFAAKTLLSILNKTTVFLENKGIKDARVSAEWLLAHILGCKRLELYLRFETLLTDEVLDKLRPLVKRRAAHEPLQYIIGEAPFGELMLRVESGVLIPRPETEELCERIIEKNKNRTINKILDLGTGTGAIAITLAKAFPGAMVVATDTNEQALALAAENAKRQKVDSQMQVLRSSWLNNVTGSYDIIVSNPPYLTEFEWEDAEPEVRDHEPRSALVPQSNDPHGIDDLYTLILASKDFLNPGGQLFLETGIAQHERLTLKGQEAGYRAIESLRDLSGRDRFMGFVVE